MSIRFLHLQSLSALFFSLFLASMFLALVTPLWAQKDGGAIVGVVRDPTGAVVASAKVTVTDVDRGIQVTLSTNDAGEYVASPLRIGRYTVTVEKQGFKKAVAGPVQVNIQDRVGVDLKLEPGMATEVVTVTSESTQLETEASDLGQVVDSRRINALPLNGRNYAQLVLLGVGIAAAEPGSHVETTYGFSSNGARSLQNNFLLDGIDNNANLGDVLNGAAYVVQPSVDAIAESKVETNSYSAEFGRGNGAIMNAVIKSDANQIHGDVFEFLRNEKVDATNAFDIFGQQPYKQNQFAFTLGGPIIKNKMFFFGDYEGLRIRQALPQLSTVPTPAEVGGDFSVFLQTNVPLLGVLDCNGDQTYQGEIFDPTQAQTNSAFNGGPCSLPIGTTGPNYTGTPTNKFTNPGGTSTAIDPLGQELANLFPAPNAPQFGPQAFLSDPKRSETENKFDIRIDHTLSNKDNFFARYSYGNDSNFLPSPFSNVLDGGSFQDGYSNNTAHGLAGSEIHSFRNNLINEFRFGFNYLNSHRYNLYSNVNVSQQLPIPFPGVPFEAGQNIGGLPYLSFGDGTAGIGASEFLPAIEKQHSYVFTDNLSWTHGLQYEAAYTFSHALDNASSASLGSVNNGDFQDQRYPNQNHSNADFDVRQRFVFSYVYDLPFGRGRTFAKGASGIVNQIIGDWQMTGVFSAATGNYDTATDINDISGGDCGGTFGFYCSRPNLVGNPNAKPCIPGTLFNTCAFGDNTNLGTFGNAGRNIIEGPGYKTWDTSLVKQFPINEQKHLEFRAEFFNVLNDANYLFGQFGAISAEPTHLELGQSGFGLPLAARPATDSARAEVLFLKRRFEEREGISSSS